MCRSIRLFTVAMLLVILCAGCGLGRQMPNTLNNEPYHLSIHSQTGDSGDGLSAAGDNQEIRMLSDSAPVGDAEVPNPRPADNRALQQQFPHVLALHGPAAAGKQLALTFDDGPDTRFTPQVLDVLKKHQVKATFFVMGSRVDGHPEVTKRMAREGHALGNHTYWHPKLYQDNVDRLRWELRQTDQSLLHTIGYVPRLFRAPYGGLNRELVAELDRQRYSVIGWSIDSRDWTQADAATVESNIMKGVHPGGIILLHSGGHWTQNLSGMVEALDTLIPKLQAQGYTFVTIPEMLAIPERKL